MAYTMKFVGLDELQRGLIERSHLEAAKTVVAKNGSRLSDQGAGTMPLLILVRLREVSVCL